MTFHLRDHFGRSTCRRTEYHLKALLKSVGPVSWRALRQRKNTSRRSKTGMNGPFTITCNLLSILVYCFEKSRASREICRAPKRCWSGQFNAIGLQGKMWQDSAAELAMTANTTADVRVACGPWLGINYFTHRSANFDFTISSRHLKFEKNGSFAPMKISRKYSPF